MHTLAFPYYHAGLRLFGNNFHQICYVGTGHNLTTDSIAAQALSIGVHRVSAGMPQPMLLMQVMPGILSRRVFSPCSTLKQIEAGYLSSPDPSK